MILEKYINNGFNSLNTYINNIISKIIKDRIDRYIEMCFEVPSMMNSYETLLQSLENTIDTSGIEVLRKRVLEDLVSSEKLSELIKINQDSFTISIVCDDYQEIKDLASDMPEILTPPVIKMSQKTNDNNGLMMQRREFLDKISTMQAEEIISFLSRVTLFQIIPILEQYIGSDHKYHKEMPMLEAKAKMEILHALANISQSPGFIQESLKCSLKILNETKAYSNLLNVYNNEQE